MTKSLNIDLSLTFSNRRNILLHCLSSFQRSKIVLLYRHVFKLGLHLQVTKLSPNLLMSLTFSDGTSFQYLKRLDHVLSLFFLAHKEYDNITVYGRKTNSKQIKILQHSAAGFFFCSSFWPRRGCEQTGISNPSINVYRSLFCNCVHGNRQHQLGQARYLLGPFTIGPSGNQTGKPDFTSRGNHQILYQKYPLQAVGLLLWLGARRHWCRRREYYICPAPLHQPPNYPPNLNCHTLALQGTLRPHLIGH